MIKKLDDIQNVLYINLEHRTDRKEHIEKQLAMISINGIRFNAIKDIEKPARGCTNSHIGCIEFAIKNNWNHVLILEDDAMFLDIELFKIQINNFLKTHNKWDVLIISGNNIGDYQIIDDTCVKIKKCQCATVYLVNGHYLEKLLDNFKESLITGYPVDLWWWNLQEIDNWFLLTPLNVVQREDYSDIEKTNVNYINQMLKLTG